MGCFFAVLWTELYGLLLLGGFLLGVAVFWGLVETRIFKGKEFNYYVEDGHERC